eukprot:TRINITY_DN626_c0_g1_i1.p1 TRINITY_DN626_c0_g1~~TRINITY_DN626_c0_g1_i1.p1  ORF type:complete len:474 (-),score=91.60 TRINITY_DN626_c0_g1_i1:1199-2620(-)
MGDYVQTRTDVVFGLGVAYFFVSIVTLILFFYRRKMPPLRARAPILVLISGISLLVMVVYTTVRQKFLPWKDFHSCLDVYWLLLVFIPSCLIPYLLRCIRLYAFWYHTNRAFMDDMKVHPSLAKAMKEQQSLSMLLINRVGSLFKPFRHHRWLAERFHVKVFSLIMGFILLVLAILQVVFFDELVRDGEKTCGPIVRGLMVGLAIVILIFVLFFSLVIMKIRHISDEFSINRELQFVCVACIVCTTAFFVLMMMGYDWPSYPYAGWCFAVLAIHVMVVSVAIPLVGTYTYNRMVTRENMVVMAHEKMPLFRGAKSPLFDGNLLSILQDPPLVPVFMDYVRSQMLLGIFFAWERIHEFRTWLQVNEDSSSQEDIRKQASHIVDAYFREDHSYELPDDDVPSQMKQSIVKTFDNADAVDPSLFDEVAKILHDLLISGFRTSHAYFTFRKKQSRANALEDVMRGERRSLPPGTPSS